MKHFFLITFVFFNINIALSQTIKATVIDKTEQPIAYATVQINGFGILTNEEGKFNINKDDFNKKDIVVISFLGFEKLEITINDLTSQNYVLKEKINDLSEVFISNKKLSIDDILTKMKENLKQNYTTDLTKQEIFTRNTYTNNFKKFEFEIKKSTLISKKELKNLNKSIDSILKHHLKKTSKSYAETLSNLVTNQDSSKIKIIKSTQLINKKEDLSQSTLQKIFLQAIASNLDKNATYKVKSGLLPVADSLKLNTGVDKKMYPDSLISKNKKRYYNGILKNYLFKDKTPFTFVTNTQKYNYELTGISNYEDEFVYVINFKPKSSSAKFTGTMFVNGYDFAIVKLDFSFAKNKRGKGINLKLLLGLKYRNNLWNSSVLYKKNGSGAYSIYFIKQELGNYAYFSRPFKIKKNKASASETKKLIKIDVLMELTARDKIEMFIIDQKQINKTYFNKFQIPEKYKINYIPKYSPEIWKGYHVLSPIKEITDYKTGAEIKDNKN